MKGPQRETPKVDRSRRKADPQDWVAKPKVGDRLGSFRLLQLLGEGGAGVVYRAEHSFLKRPVAIKVLHPELYLRPAMVARFFQEALAVNRARHRNIIDITDVVASEGSPPFIVMELLVGEDLGDAIDRRAPMSTSFTMAVARQICAALAVVHGLGIVHRDLKPENIFLVSKGDAEESKIPTVKLLDFGIAKFLDNEKNRRRTWSGNVLGTPAYMPIEQLHGLPVDNRADIYAVGVVLFEMLTGRLPFEIESLDDITEGALLMQPPPPSKRTVGPAPEPIPEEMDALVLRCLADSPAKRFQSVEELLHALNEIVLPVTADGVPQGPGQSSRPSAAREDRSPAAAGRTRADPHPGAQPAASGAASALPAAQGAASGSAALPRIPTPPSPAVHQSVAGATQSVAGATQSVTGATQSVTGATQSVAGATQSVAGATQSVAGTDQRARPRSMLIVGLALVLAALGGVGAWAFFLPVKPIGRIAWPPTRDSGGPTDTASRSISLTSEPARAKVYRADTDSLLGQTPARVEVAGADPLVLSVRRAGFQEARITLAPDESGPIHVRLEPLAPEPGSDASAPEPAMEGPAPQPERIRIVHVPVPGPRDKPRRPPPAMVTEQGIVDPFDK